MRFLQIPNFHSYADYLQIYLNCTDSPTYCPDRISNCISALLKWVNSNSLKFNPYKNKSIFLHLPLRSNTLPNLPPVISGNIDIPYTKHVRNLGVQLDSVLSMDYQISNMHKSIHYHLHSIRSIRNSIPFSITIIISSSYI